MKKRNKKNRKSWINGTKGAISLFLAVLMTPFLTIALMLVEVGRYNSAVSLLDEVMSISSISTLANYDSYLHDRWGLLALDQGVDLQTVYADNLENNVQIMGDSLKVNKMTLNATYDLAQSNVLRAQILEYSKLNVPTKLAMEVFNLADIVKNLESKMTGFRNMASLVTRGVDAIDSAITIAESAEKLKESANKLDGLRTEYEAKYVAFETAMNTLISNLQRKRSLESQLSQLERELKDLRDELDDLLGEQKKQEEESEEDDGTTETTEPTETTVPTEAESEEVKAKRKEIEEKEKEINRVNREIRALNNTIGSNRSTAVAARDQYAAVLQQIASELGNFKTLMADCSDAVKSIQNDIAGAVTDILSLEAEMFELEKSLEDEKKTLEKYQKDLEDMENNGTDTSDSAYVETYKKMMEQEKKVNDLQVQLADMETEASACEAASNGVGKMADEWSTSFKDYSDATLGKAISGFEELRAKVLEVNPNAATANTAKITREVYKQVALAGYINAADIDKYLKEQEKELKNGTLKALLDGLVAIYNGIMGLSIFFDDDLDACIDVGYYNLNFGGLPGGSAAEGGLIGVIGSIGTLCNTVKTVKEEWDDKAYISALWELRNLGSNIVDVFASIGEMLVQLLESITELFTGYEKWYYSAYCAYTLTCRTDHDQTGGVSMSTMTGSVGSDSFPEEEKNMEIPVFGELFALIDTINTYINSTGSDLSFSGAELEYILLGSNSEIANQLYVFCAIYLIRLIVCAPVISSNVEVQALAASATLGYPVVMGLYYFLEPLVQTILLVNGKSQGLLPTTIYLSPSGLPKLVQALVSFCHMTDQEAKKLGQNMVDAFAESQEDYDAEKEKLEVPAEEDDETGDKKKKKKAFELSYRDYCLLILLVTVKKDQQIARLSNIIQMETLTYYKNKGASFTFDLRKAYTYIDATADVDISQIMPSLTDSSWFSVTRQISRGY